MFLSRKLHYGWMVSVARRKLPLKSAVKMWTIRSMRQSDVSDSSGTVDLRRNIPIFLVDAVGWNLGQSFLSPQTILPLFIALLSKSNLLIGLIVAVQSVGQLVPQLFAANFAEHLPRKRGYVVAVGVLLERAPYLVLALALVWLRAPALLLALFFAAWAIANFGTGINTPPFWALYAKGMPAERRGRVSGIGTSVGTLLAVGGAFLATFILDRIAGLAAFTWIFAIGFVILLVSVIPLGFLDEPMEETPETRRHLGSYLRDILAILDSNRAFARYVVVQSTIQLAAAAIPFITSYAVLRLGATEGNVGLFTAILMAATAAGSLLLGWIADSRGYRRVLVVGSALALLLFGLLIPSPSLNLVYLAFFLSGLVTSAVYLGNNMAMEFCKPAKAATYAAIVFTAGAPMRIVGPLVLGVVADAVGMPLVFALVAASALIAFYLSLFRLREPRTTRIP